MAKTRAKRVQTRVQTRARTGAGAPPAAAKKRTRVKIDARCLSRRIEFTPRLIAYIRQRHEEVGEGADVISRTVGVAKATIQRLIREQGWTPLARGPRDVSRADALAQEVRALARSTLSARSDGEGDFVAPARDEPGSSAEAAGEEPPPVDVDAAIERLLRLVDREIAVYENLRAQLGNTPQPHHAANKTAHAIASLTATLDELRRMRAANNEPARHDVDDFPADPDAFRNELARRIRAFVESRRGSGSGAAGNGGVEKVR